MCSFNQEKKKPRFTYKLLIQNYNDISDKGYILEIDVSYPNRYRKYTVIFCFELK